MSLETDSNVLPHFITFHFLYFVTAKTVSRVRPPVMFMLFLVWKCDSSKLGSAKANILITNLATFKITNSYYSKRNLFLVMALFDKTKLNSNKQLLPARPIILMLLNSIC